MKFIKTLKALPLLSLLTFSLAASSGLAMAGDNNHDKKYQSRNSTTYEYKRDDRQKHNQQAYLKEKHTRNQPPGGQAFAQNKHYEPKYAVNKHYEKKHNSNQRYQHGHGHNHDYRYGYAHRHSHNEHHANRYQRNVIVQERQYRNLRDFRLMLGLHTNNVDIIYRD